MDLEIKEFALASLAKYFLAWDSRKYVRLTVIHE